MNERETVSPAQAAQAAGQPWQFSLRWLLAAVTLVAVGGAVYFWTTWRQTQMDRLSSELTRRGHEFAVAPSSHSWRGPALVQLLIKNDDREFDTFPWDAVTEFSDIRTLLCYHRGATDRDLEGMARQTQVGHLTLVCNNVMTSPAFAKLFDGHAYDEVQLSGDTSRLGDAWSLVRAKRFGVATDRVHYREILDSLSSVEYLRLRFDTTVEASGGAPAIFPPDPPIDLRLRPGTTTSGLSISGAWVPAPQLVALLDSAPKFELLHVSVDRFSVELARALRRHSALHEIRIHAREAGPEALRELRGCASLWNVQLQIPEITLDHVQACVGMCHPHSRVSLIGPDDPARPLAPADPSLGLVWSVTKLSLHGETFQRVQVDLPRR